MTDSLLLIAGQSGSKSTFIGGLYHHIKDRNDVSVKYQMLTGDKAEFENNVLTMMGQRRQYPKQTSNSYAVEFTIFSGWAQKNTTVKFMDIPGEQQRDAINEISQKNINTEEVRTKYNEEVKEKLKTNRPLSAQNDDWKTLYTYTYQEANRVIFLLNIHKLLFDTTNKDPIYGSDLLEATSNDATRCALIASAIDILDYVPQESDINQSLSDVFIGAFGAGARMADESLLHELQQEISTAVSPKTNNIITTAQLNHNIDVFGVAVPSEDPFDPQNLNLVRDGTTFRTIGYDQVIEWLSK